MSINEILLSETEEYLDKYDCHFLEIEQFLTHNGTFLERQHNAINIIEGILTRHGKKALLHYVAELARVEHGIREVEPWIRDHVVHALLSYLLGIYLNEKYLKLQHNNVVDDFQWKLAGLLHDVGYPIQIAKDIINPFTVKINEVKRSLGVNSPDIFCRVIPDGLNIISNNQCSIDLIQKRLEEWELKIDAREEYRRMIESCNICHGIISSLAVLYVIDLIYQKNNPNREYFDIYTLGDANWNQIFFDNDVISACSAIYIHNLPKRCFVDAKIDRLKAPIAFLLKLSDCLQEWERPSFAYPGGIPASQFSIRVNSSGLIFHSDIPIDKRKKIIDEIQSSLVAPDILIG